MPKFRVLAGVHSEGGKVYSKGEVVDSATDLSKLNYPSSQKFLLLDNPTPNAGQSSPTETKESSWSEEELSQLVVSDLRQLAEDEEIDLLGATRKDEIIQRILNS